ncbi:MAG: hypothetical protein UX20_C0006G0003 [Candidatus Magasanikbacteria bacterium GW2011_GWC2_45_8]|uniref:Transposase n=1 Tax=Candidatus Magasanikbacteria bacterium GW2011_GWC2_45_8 TaxID=1619050 RepID=A0A0G1N0I0_9BACT|nr:MAG: hypothetical protein UX20_C0006G0003 [Candidatus Magasanikbacteria bacterium GW2011_GWC2_45_8]
MAKKPRTFSPQEKAQVALIAIKGEKTISQISSETICIKLLDSETLSLTG